ncbi:MAG: hypothetical protein HUJ76_13385, partial [Parasporobacterium sp.]|nr:hypothetical protein [Parasporobacterium sp.]
TGKVVAEATNTTIEIAGSVYSNKDEALYNVMTFNNADLVFAESYGKYEIWIGSEDATVAIKADSVSSRNGFNAASAPAFAEIRGKNIAIITENGVGDKDNYISIDCSEDGELKLDNTSGDVFITALRPFEEGVSSLTIGQLKTSGELNIALQGRKLLAKDQDNSLVSSGLNITDAYSIGTEETPVNNRFTGYAELDLTAEESIYLNQEGDAYVNRIAAGDTVSLITIPAGNQAGNIIDASAEGTPAVTADHIILITTGEDASVGTPDKKITLEFKGTDNELDLESVNDIYAAVGSVTDSEGNAADLNIKLAYSVEGSIVIDINNNNNKTVTLTRVDAGV